MSRVRPNQFDSPWKEALEIYLRSILEFCFPPIAAEIDWSARIVFLDKELQEIVRDASLGGQRIDKLIRVRLRDGRIRVILLHIEVQHRPDWRLPLRLYQYNHRSEDRFGQPVLTLAVLADDNPNWRPSHYERELLGCRVRFDFPGCKLLDRLAAAQRQVEARRPSAVIIVANWIAQQTRKDMRQRYRLRWQLTRRLYEAKYPRKDILELYRLIDWLLSLPPELTRKYKAQVIRYEAKKRMPYVTTTERMAREEGLRKGIEQGIEQGREQGLERGLEQGLQQGITALQDSLLETLSIRFGKVEEGIRKRILRATEIEQLRRFHRWAVQCGSLRQFREHLPK